MKKIFVLVLLCISWLAHATTYYVKNGGNDGLDGRSDANAWATTDKVTSFSSSPGFAPGDFILFRKGDSWNMVAGNDGFLIKGGTSAGNVTISSYGTGAKPRWTAYVTANSGWTHISGNLWDNSNAAFSLDVGNVIFNNDASVGVKKETAGALSVQGDYFSNTATHTVRMYSVSDPGTYYSGGIKCCVKNNIFRISDSDGAGYGVYITLDGIDFHYGGAHGVAGYQCRHVQIRNCDFSWIGGCMIYSGMRYIVMMVVW
jgi:hypothetical protein